ncbi:hypothetical protein HAX54_000798, partial [Datura stramonium]|nr:hypothetical protein [Datura stramonium]
PLLGTRITSVVRRSKPKTPHLVSGGMFVYPIYCCTSAVRKYHFAACRCCQFCK